MLSPLQYDTLDHFIAWLETCDPRQTFNFMVITTCALGRYDLAHGAAPGPEVKSRFDGRGMEIILGKEQQPMSYLRCIPLGDVLKRAKEVRGW